MPQPECAGKQARVTQNTRLADLNLPAAHRVDDRRTEVIANRLAFWNGSQLAVDTTLVSPLTSTGEPRRRGGSYAGAALQDARKSKERAYPELRRSRRCRLVVLAIEVGGRWSHEATQFLSLLAHDYRFARQMDSHTHPCGHARLCVVFAFPAAPGAEAPDRFGRPRFRVSKSALWLFLWTRSITLKGCEKSYGHWPMFSECRDLSPLQLISDGSLICPRPGPRQH